MKPLFVGVVALVLISASVLAATDSAVPARVVGDEQLVALENNPNRSPDSLLELALGYDERHDARAADTYRAAAAGGVAVAELRLGALFETGDGVAQSYAEARAHYQRAVELGVPEANLRLGLLYLEGWSVPRDAAIAVQHIERAASAGYKPAQQVLSDMFFAGIGITADPKKALFWAERAASDRDPEALMRVGSVYLKAVKVPQDLARARDWFQLSAEQDFSSGMLAMAGTFLRPGADAESAKMGLRWLDLAVEEGNSAAAFHRAGFYLMNPQEALTPENEARAKALLVRAADAKEPAALEVLELVKGGQRLADAFRFVVVVPYDDRYVQRFRALGPVQPGENRPPRPVKISRPIYPAALRLTQTEGEVLVEFVVDKTGRVHEAHTVRSSHPGFADLSVAAVSTWRFEPGYREGRPVNTRMQIPVHFQLSALINPADRQAARTGVHP
jgi:TonB family protein